MKLDRATARRLLVLKSALHSEDETLVDFVAKTIQDKGSDEISDIKQESMSPNRYDYALYLINKLLNKGTGGELLNDGSHQGEEKTFQLGNNSDIKMCWCPSGSFFEDSWSIEVPRDLDSPLVEECVKSRIVITRGFWLGKTPITQEQWESLMGENPSHFRGRDLPVENVSWMDISKPGGFLSRANESNPNNGLFALPTRAQWQLAARASTTIKSNDEETKMIDSSDCWHSENSRNKTQPVGYKKPNSWGLQDMLGNVWEWCEDGDGDYQPGINFDPVISTVSGKSAMGGAWNCSVNNCSFDSVNMRNPSGFHFNLGFRLLLTRSPWIDGDYDHYLG